MLSFEIKKDAQTNEKTVVTNLDGKLLLTTPQLNKGTAFSEAERAEFGLVGKLPYAIESLDEQVRRTYKQYSSFKGLMQKNIFLRSVHETNEILFYKLVKDHAGEMLPVLYTPIVGTAVREFSSEFRRPRGLYISYPERDKMLEILANRTHPNIELIVTTDGEGVLGIGDQGIGAMDIPIAKLMVYSIAGGINPLKTLPIMLDVGTNNQALLDDPMYLGWRHERISGKDYDDFIGQFIDAVKQTFPNIYLHWEDFGGRNARHNLDTYRHELCSFNDDIQGTGVVSLAALIAAIEASGTSMSDQRIVVFGAGSAGTGISEQLCDALVRSGLDETEAQSRFYLLNSKGLMTTETTTKTDVRYKFAQNFDRIKNWQLENEDKIELLDVIKNVKPTILIGCSTITGAFTETIITEMSQHVDRPIIFPLSNPTEKSEAHPKNLLRWSHGKALIATGSPFDPVTINDQEYVIAQCNNALVFPGIGVGVLVSKPKVLTDNMLWAACQVTKNAAPIFNDPKASLLPALDNCEDLSRKIAIAVAKQAIVDGVSDINEADIEDKIDQISWEPKYLPYKRGN